MLTIYGMKDSGNCYKPRLLCALTRKPFRHVEVSTIDGSTRLPAYLAKNPNGKVPLLEFEDGRFLPESNAILSYLGEDTAFVPHDLFERATMLSWMFFEQYSHEPHIAVRRSLHVYAHRKADATPERLAATLTGGMAGLGVMERRLTDSPFLAGDASSLADVALYPYTNMAPEGGYDLSAFPAVVKWLRRIERLDGFRPIDWLPDA